MSNKLKELREELILEIITEKNKLLKQKASAIKKQSSK